VRRPVLLARVVPASLLGRRSARHVVERNALVYRRLWMVLVSGFFEPVFYLFALGIGLGALVGEIALGAGEVVDYATYVAPALLAASAMNGAVYESTMGVYFKLREARTYDAILSTPVEPTDLALGEITTSQLRGALYAATFLLIMTAMGLVRSPWALLALPAAVLIGFAFGAAGMAATSFMRSWQDFDLIQVVVLPLFLFSATFFPLEVYPPTVRPLVALSPLFHGVALIRGLTLGALDWSLLGHAAFLVTMTAACLWVASRRLTALLRA
jgi:lipooligosaccharide transport system permease protein